MYWPVSRVEFIMALLKECGNTENLPDESDGEFAYFLHADGKSGYVSEIWWNNYSDLLDSEIIYTFGGVSC